MKYYSETLKKLFDTTEDLKNAEAKHAESIAAAEKKRAERSARAKEVEDAYKAYKKLLDAFVKDYGSFHMTINDSRSLFDLLDTFVF